MNQSYVQLCGHPCIHAQDTGWQSGLQSCIAPGLHTHIVQELNVGIVRYECTAIIVHKRCELDFWSGIHCGLIVLSFNNRCFFIPNMMMHYNQCNCVLLYFQARDDVIEEAVDTQTACLYVTC